MSTDSVWVDRRTSALAADEQWEPDSAHASQRFHARRERARSARRRAFWLAPVGVVLAGLILVTVPATRAAAQRLATLLRVERTEGVRVPAGSPALVMRSFQLEVISPPAQTQRVADAAAAARLARFTARARDRASSRTPRSATRPGFSCRGRWRCGSRSIARSFSRGSRA